MLYHSSCFYVLYRDLFLTENVSLHCLRIEHVYKNMHPARGSSVFEKRSFKSVVSFDGKINGKLKTLALA